MRGPRRDPTDRVWKALADPTRRDALDLLREAPRSTGEVCARFPHLSRFAVMKHLAVLEAAGLVLVRREGRVRTNVLNVVPIQQIYERFVRPYEAQWASGLLTLKRRAEAEPDAPSTTPPTSPAATADSTAPIAARSRSRARSPDTAPRPADVHATRRRSTTSVPAPSPRPPEDLP